MKTKQIPFKIEEDLKEQFDRIIKNKNKNRSALLRSWIKYYVEHEGNTDFRDAYEQGFQDGRKKNAQSFLNRLQMVEKELHLVEKESGQLSELIEDLKVILNKG